MLRIENKYRDAIACYFDAPNILFRVRNEWYLRKYKLVDRHVSELR